MKMENMIKPLYRVISDFRTRWVANIKDIDGFSVLLRGMTPKIFSFEQIGEIK